MGGEKVKMDTKGVSALVAGILVLSVLATVPTMAADSNPPSVTNPSTDPSTIANDGTEYTELTVQVSDDTAVDNVTVDLTSIGGEVVYMSAKSQNVFNYTTNATCSPGTYSLAVNATGIYGNYNNTESISLTVKGVTQIADSLGVNDASGSPGDYVEVPVNIENVKNGPINTIEFRIEYNESVINLTGVTTSDLTTNWDCSLPEKDHVKLSQLMTAGSMISNGTSGSVAILNFSVVGTHGDSSPMNLTEIYMLNANGDKGTAPAKNGTFKVGLRGDLDGDGASADIDDLSLMVKVYLGLIITPDKRYDLDGDGNPADIDDLSLMVKAYLGLITL